MRPYSALLLAAGLACLLGAAAAAPLPPAAVPDPLKTWVPWTLHDHEMLLCPGPYNRDPGAEDDRACAWPSQLELQVTAGGATFRFEVEVFGAPALLNLPGEPGRWPEDVKLDGRPLAVTAVNERPIAEVAAGRHVISGSLRWQEMPANLLLPAATGSLRVSVRGKRVDRVPDAEGRILLEESEHEAQASDAITVRVSRLIDDDIPLRVTTHFDIALSGKPREIQLPLALLPGFVADSLESQLPARLHEQGLLRVQGRPGNWSIDVGGRLMVPAGALALPAGQGDEIWSFRAHNDLRIVSVDGVTAVDPKQVPIPEGWRPLPAYQVKGGQTMKLTESRRGNPQPAADKLTLARQIWLDFDGRGYTFHDAIAGTLTRSWRLEAAAPDALGRATADGVDQPITRRAGAAADGVELRHGTLQLAADSRLEGSGRTLSATGWSADFNAAQAVLNLPPGWQLLHAGGVDRAVGSWLSKWTLWDFFFILLSVLSAAKLAGPRAAALLAAALLLTWHVPSAPHFVWLLLLALLALQRVLPVPRLQLGATRVAQVCVAAIALWLLPYAVQQTRLSFYPALEYPWLQAERGQTATGVGAVGGRLRDRAAAPAAPPPPTEGSDAREPNPVAESDLPKSPPEVERKSVDAMRPTLSKTAPVGVVTAELKQKTLYEIDPRLRVQTGPGLPAWQWNSHQLLWQGPVQGAQEINLYLLPPAGTVALRLAGVVLLIAALWLLARRLPGWPSGSTGWRRDAVPLPQDGGPDAASPASLAPLPATMLCALAVGLAAFMIATDSEAAPPPAANAPTLSRSAEASAANPDPALLDALRSKLTAPPACLPQCADIARLRVEAQGGRVQLRLEVHALADVTLPLPGQGVNWRPTSVVGGDGKPIAVRRDEAGALWMAARAGITQVLLAADVGDASSVEIALPMPPRELSVAAAGWALSGLDARGQASGALTLSRSAPGGAGADGGTQRDALPPFVRIERIVHLGLLWSVETRISRVAPSHAPVRVRVKLLEGEAVNDEVVRVEDGFAILQLGAQDSASFSSTLKEAAQLRLSSATEPSQIELWHLDPSPQWHVGWSGIAPVQYTDRVGGDLLPSWQPWPGESVTIDVSRPAGAAGQTLTIDNLQLAFAPGLRATGVIASATLRSSQGSNHRVQLPEGADFQSLMLDGQAQPIQPQGRELLIPITPGEHTLRIEWREPRGLGWWFATRAPSLGASGVNARTEVSLPAERVVLAVGGPRIGPAVLFWGVLLVLLLAAVVLGRSGVAPLGIGAWFLLGLGLAQSSLLGAAVVVSWFFALAARRRLGLIGGNGTQRRQRWTANFLQILLIMWTLLAALALFNAVRVGLLGYPDLMIDGNGSSPNQLNWYQDRFSEQARGAWVLSAPVLAYRLLMLAWALWLAASVLRWIRWAWDSYGSAGYWRGKPAVRVEA